MKTLIDFFRKFMPYIKGHYRTFVLAIFGSLLTALSTAGIAYAVNPLLGTLNGKIPKDIAFFSFEKMADNNLIAIAMPLLIIILYLAKSGGTYMQSYFMNYIGQDIVRQLRAKMLNNMLNLELSFFNKIRSGELMSRITNDIGTIRAAVSNYITEFVRETITIIGLIAVVIYQNPRLAFIGLVIIPLSIIPVNLTIKKLKKYSRGLQEKNADITSRLNEIFSNIEIIKASNSEKLEVKNFEEQDKQFFKLSMKSTLIGGLTTPIMELLGAIALALIVYIATIDINSGKMTPEQFASFAAALFMVYTPLKKLVGMWGGLQIAIVSSNRIHEILEKKSEIIDGTKILQKPINTIEFKDVHFGYSKQKHALSGINLTFHKNEIVALVGKSGSGKSTLVNLILRLYECNKGDISINGVSIKEYTKKSLRDNIAIVTQRIFIFCDTIANNIAYGLEVNEERIIKALKDAQLYDYVESLEDGIHTMLDEFGTNLSGGQRQRIAIARAMYKNPDIIILDEITSALDSQTEDLIKEAIDLNRKDKIIILIAHRPSTIELANRVVNLENGTIKDIKIQKGA